MGWEESGDKADDTLISQYEFDKPTLQTKPATIVVCSHDLTMKLYCLFHVGVV